MARKVLSPEMAFDLRQVLQIAILDALVKSERWTIGDLAFQGGTSLHLVHGSPRFSEDLDFLINKSLDPKNIGNAIATRLSQDMRWCPEAMQLTLSPAKAEHNPHAFTLALKSDEIIGAVRVKVELWQAPKAAIEPLKLTVNTVSVGNSRFTKGTIYVPTLTPNEIYVDKIFAIGSRPYLKPRDFFDIYWLQQNQAKLSVTADDLQRRFDTYPNATYADFRDLLKQRLTQLHTSHDVIKADLIKWLPTHFPMAKTFIPEVVEAAIEAIQVGLTLVDELSAEQGFQP